MSDKIAKNESVEMNEKIKTPLGTIMDMAKSEIEACVLKCMGANNMPPSIMAYILRVVLLDILEIQGEQVSKELVALQKLIQAQNNVSEEQEG